jgi:hypothetical protein
MNNWLVVILCPLVVFCVRSARGDAVSLTAGRDNSIFSEVENNSGGASLIVVGMTGAGVARRSLLWFDVAAAVPHNSTIVSAALRLNLTNASLSGITDVDVTLHRLLGRWGEGTGGGVPGTGEPPAEGDSTWTYRQFNTQPWNAAGGDFNAVASAGTSIGRVLGPHDFDSTVDLVADVQQWLNNPDTNYGWLMLGNESQIRTARQFASREHAEAAMRPQLTIEYQLPVVPSDFDQDGVLDVDDLNLLLAEVNAGTHGSRFDRTADGLVNVDDVIHVVTTADEMNTYIGDVDLDGQFDTTDIVTLFQAGTYEDGAAGNAQWQTGDWDGDQDFTSSDLLLAFQHGGFEAGPRAAARAVAEPSLGPLLFGVAAGLLRRRGARSKVGLAVKVHDRP